MSNTVEDEVENPRFAPLAAAFAARREHITLIRAPFTTTWLFLTIVVRYVLAQVKFISTHRATWFVIVPIILASVWMSGKATEGKGRSSFGHLDVNGDGILTRDELFAHVDKHEALFANSSTAPSRHTLSNMSLAQFEAWLVHDDSTAFRPTLDVLPAQRWHEAEYFIADAIYWIGLGVLSSVGLGTGMHSGILFLFPHVYLIVRTAMACGHLDFWTYPVNGLYGPSSRAFHCLSQKRSPPSDEVTSWTSLFLKVTLWCVLWGAGTAIGEIPPYAVSYAAARANKRNKDLDVDASSGNIVDALKNWTIRQVQRNGFWAVLALAAWPNAAFDLCGMACGSFMMPFVTFFSAVFIGKALIKVNAQAFFFVILFSGTYILDSVRAFSKILPSFAQRWADAAVVGLIKFQSDAELRATGQAVHMSEETTHIKFALQMVVILAVAWFAKSIVDTFAQSQQEEYDNVKLRAIERHCESTGCEPDVTMTEDGEDWSDEISADEINALVDPRVDALVSVIASTSLAFAVRCVTTCPDATAFVGGEKAARTLLATTAASSVIMFVQLLISLCMEQPIPTSRRTVGRWRTTGGRFLVVLILSFLAVRG